LITSRRSSESSVTASAELAFGTPASIWAAGTDRPPRSADRQPFSTDVRT